MAKETWFPASAAFENGLIDEIIETEEKMAACLCLDKDLYARFKNTPGDVFEYQEPIVEDPFGTVRERTPALVIPADIDEQDDEQELVVNSAQERAEFCVIGGKVYKTKNKGE